jgi:serine protease Do
LLEKGQYKEVFFDIQTYQHMTDMETFESVLQKTTILHIPADESNPFGLEGTGAQLCTSLCEKYPGLKYILVLSKQGESLVYDCARAVSTPFSLSVLQDQNTLHAVESFLACLVYHLISDIDLDVSLTRASKLVDYVNAKGAALPYPTELLSTLMPPPPQQSDASLPAMEKKRNASPGKLILSIYTIIVSIAFIVSTAFAAYFFIALRIEKGYIHDDSHNDSQNGDQNGEKDTENNFPDTSERPLYKGDHINVPAPDDVVRIDTLTAAEVVAAALPSVVCVQADTGEGTGFILTDTGYVVTNYHIVDGGTDFTVILHDDTILDASYVGGDKLTDLAVLKVEPGDTRLIPIALGNSDTVRAGDSVIAIGSPGGSEYAGTATSGIVSAHNRRLTTSSLSGEGTRTMWVIQTDTAVNFGNSGGPLLNMKGQVIGINTMKYAELYFEGLGFSLPINGVMDIVNILMKHGYISKYPENCFAKINVPLGITVGAMTKTELAENGLAYGIKVQSVDAGSNAEQDGVKKDDIIVKIEGKEAKSILQVRNAVFDHREDDKIALKIYRKGKYLDINITLRAK